MKKKIAMILPNLDEDGGQTVVCTLLQNLDRHKYQTVLYVLSPAVENKLTYLLYQEKIPVKFAELKFDYNYIRIIFLVKWLDNVLQDFKPDIINVHLDTLYTWLWAVLKNKHIIFTVHSDAQRIYNRFSHNLFKILKKRKKITVIGVSQNISKHFCTVFGAENAITIYNPIDISHFKCKRIYTQKKDMLIFINIARFYPVKNHMLLIEAFARFYQNNQNTQLLLVGEGQEFNMIKEYVDRLQLNRVIKFTGSVNDVAPLLEQSDIFVLSSRSEAFPVSIIEAMAAGLPIIATKVGGLPEVVKDNGILVESENVIAMTDAMNYLANNQKLRENMGKLSEQYVEKYNIKNIIKQYEQIYDSIL